MALGFTVLPTFDPWVFRCEKIPGRFAPTATRVTRPGGDGRDDTCGFFSPQRQLWLLVTMPCLPSPSHHRRYSFSHGIR